MLQAARHAIIRKSPLTYFDNDVEVEIRHVNTLFVRCVKVDALRLHRFLFGCQCKRSDVDLS